MKSKMLRAKPEDLVVDPQVQRELDHVRVNSMAGRFEPAAFGVVTVSERADGLRYIVDGQHRTAAAIKAGHGGKLFDVRVIAGLTIQEEAALFRLLNTTVKPGPYDSFLIRLVEEEPVAVDISKIVIGHGWQVKKGPTNGCIAAVAAMEWVYRRGLLRPDAQRNLLDDTLGIITGAWDHDQDGGNSSVIKGIGLFVDRYYGEFDEVSLISNLRKALTPDRVLGKARTVKEVVGGNLYDAVLEVARTTYNTGRRRNTLVSQRA